MKRPVLFVQRLDDNDLVTNKKNAYKAKDSLATKREDCLSSSLRFRAGIQ